MCSIVHLSSWIRKYCNKKIRPFSGYAPNLRKLIWEGAEAKHIRKCIKNMIFEFSNRFIMLMELIRSGIMQLFLIFVDSRPKIRVFCIFQVGDHIPGAQGASYTPNEIKKFRNTLRLSRLPPKLRNLRLSEQSGIS